MLDTAIPIKNKKVFKSKVIELYDPIHLQRYWYVNVDSSKEFEETLEKVIPYYRELVEVSKTEGENDGECLDLVINGRLIIIFWCNKSSISSIVHECLHAVLFCAKSRGIKVEESDETVCYMLGFLVTGACSRLGLKLKSGIV